MINTNQLKDIEKAVSQLSPQDLREFRHWFAEFDAEAWDKQFEKDVSAGRLDELAQSALKHLRKGNTTEL